MHAGWLAFARRTFTRRAWGHPQRVGVISELARITSELARVTSELARVTSELAGVTSELAGVTSELAGVTSELVVSDLRVVYYLRDFAVPDLRI